MKGSTSIEAKRSQVDLPQGGTGRPCALEAGVAKDPTNADADGHGHPAPLASVPPPAAFREVRLSGFPEALAEVLRHRSRGGVRGFPDAAPTGFSDARFVVQPAYSLGPHSVSPLRRLAGGCAPSDPRTGHGAP